ncbi:hypothetical protein [Methylobacterium brachythecii]|uniref:Uncharacterized protein n=1 Tax=Methylobacterium brachythecii TaxID=1176177 RepID=A0A7W6ANS0_9HYPH|nr:hypothetical protein [Methylobacterium brachythecii]MBB3903961.1 hypothetical protein [Methylobacterium brachythecii]GLS42706.1 hypothetical protein GCM10007884_06910 [Methylobacterium brachythecii]
MKFDSARYFDDTYSLTTDEPFDSILENAALPRPIPKSVGSRYPFMTTAIFVGHGPLGSAIDALGGPEALVSLCGMYLYWIGARQPEAGRIYLESTTSSAALASQDAWMRMLEDMEFGRFRIIVFPNLECLFEHIPDAYKFNKYCKQYEVEIHTMDRGPTSDMDFAMYQYVSREDLLRRSQWSKSPAISSEIRPSEAGRPLINIPQLETIIGLALDPAAGSPWMILPSEDERRLVLADEFDARVSIDGRSLETGLLRACSDALDEAEANDEPSAFPGPPAEVTDRRDIARRRLRSEINSASRDIATFGSLGWLEWDAVTTIRQSLSAIELISDGPARHRLRLSFQPGLALPDTIVPGAIAMDIVSRTQASSFQDGDPVLPPLRPMRPRAARSSRQI